MSYSNMGSDDTRRSWSEPPHIGSKYISDKSKTNPASSWRDMGVRRTFPVALHQAKLEPWHSAKVINYSHRTASLRLSKLSISNKRKGVRIKAKKTILSLRGTELQNPPKDLFEMTDLESLSMSPERESCLEFKLTEVPKEIKNLNNLRQLVLDTNELREIPNEISDLNQLETLTLSNNRLAELPGGFAKLSSLRSLHLANNRFAEFPNEICGLVSLSFLDLSDNSIREIPDEFDWLSSTLQTLLLYINDLQRLPESFGNLTELTTLWLGKNRLESLPKSFGKLVNLDWSDFPSSSNIDENPLKSPPLWVCQRGVSAIRDYFSGNKPEKITEERREEIELSLED
ncbi:uncharacterized protein LOC120334536 [Styela clava]